MKQSKPLVFFGSGAVAAATLGPLLESFAVSVVVTKPNKDPRIEPPVEALAKAKSLPLFSPADKSELNELFTASRLTNHCGLIVDYGLIVPQSVIDYFELGIINSHFSLLPRLRGADPITFALLGGDEVTGVSLMQIVAAMDEGPLLAQEELAIDAEDDGQSLTNKLVDLSNDMLRRYLPRYLAGELKPLPQDESIEPTYSRKLTKEDGQVDWQKPAEQLAREVRAFSLWPYSFGRLAGLDVILTSVEPLKASGQPGEVFVRDGELAVYCGENALLVKCLKVAGKGEMDGKSFINGYMKGSTKHQAPST